ncbi:hypothetical protein Q4I32_000003, partial [Leishmania shawi]
CRPRNPAPAQGSRRLPCGGRAWCGRVENGLGEGGPASGRPGHPAARLPLESGGPGGVIRGAPVVLPAPVPPQPTRPAAGDAACSAPACLAADPPVPPRALYAHNACALLVPACPAWVCHTVPAAGDSACTRRSPLATVGAAAGHGCRWTPSRGSPRCDVAACTSPARNAVCMRLGRFAGLVWHIGHSAVPGALTADRGGAEGGVTALAEQRAARHLRAVLSLLLCPRCRNPRYSQVSEQSWVRVAFCRLVSPASLSF